MMAIGDRTVTNNLTENFRAALLRVLKCFQCQNGSAFADGQAIAVRVEGAALSGGERLQGIETGEDHLTESVVAAGQNALAVTASQKFPGVADGVGAGSASVGDDGDRAAETESVGEIERLALRLILDDASGLASVDMRRFECLAVIRFAQTHSAAGGAENDGQVIRRRPTGLLPRFVRGQQKQFGGAIQAALATLAKLIAGKASGQHNLTGIFHALTGNVKERHWPNRDTPLPKSLGICVPPNTQRRNDSSAGDHDAGR